MSSNELTEVSKAEYVEVKSLAGIVNTMAKMRQSVSSPTTSCGQMKKSEREKGNLGELNLIPNLNG